MIFSDLNFKLYEATNQIQLTPDEDSVVNILKYLPVDDKNDLINLTLQNSLENGVYNRVKMNMYFRLYIVYMYTDLEFSDTEKDDPSILFDILESNGIIDAVLNNMEKEELRTLNDWLFDTMESKAKYNNTIASVIHGFIEELPKNAAKAQETIAKFDPEKFQAVLDFARAANGGRDIG